MPLGPSFIPAEHTVSVAFRYTQFGQHMENIMYFRKYDTAAWVTGEYTELLTTLKAQWVADGQDWHASDCVLDELYLTDLTTEFSPTASLSVNEAGGSVYTGMPGNVTFTTTFRSNGRGRVSRGRNYWIGIPSNVVVDNHVTTPFMDAVIAYYEGLRDAIDATDTGFAHVLVSRRSEGEWRETAFILSVTSYHLADNFVDSQRRRLTGRGS